jgi:UDP-N-acetylglucosamine acyltransferase
MESRGAIRTTKTPREPDPLAAPRIDPRAVVSPEAKLGDDVTVGPFAVIEAGVVVGSGTRIWANAYLCTGTTLGRDNAVHMGAVLGHEPQDLAYRGAPTTLEIGDRNVFREGSQVHRGTAAGSRTVVGSDCFVMTNAHVAHNCEIEDGVILATGAVLGGHVRVGSRAFVSGNCVAHQHSRIGRLALLQGGTRVSRDVPPFVIATDLNRIRGLNLVGLRRAGLDANAIGALRRLYRALFLRRQNLKLARERLLEEEASRGGLSAESAELLAFIDASTRGICSAVPRGGSRPAETPEI